MSALSMALAVFVGLLCEAILYGIYIVLAGGALYLLIRNRHTGGPGAQRANSLMITITVLMFVFSTVHILLSIRAGITAFCGQTPGSHALIESPNDPTVWIQLLLELLNCLMSDIIVSWRIWEFWARQKRVMIIPVAGLAGGVISGVGMTLALSKLPTGMQLTDSETVIVWFGCFGLFTLLSNLYSVVMIAWEAWVKLRTMKDANIDISGGQYLRIMALMVESGAIYCVVLTTTIVVFMVDSNSVYIMADVVIHLTGIYPTVIIVLVCLKLTFRDNVQVFLSRPGDVLKNGTRHSVVHQDLNRRGTMGIVGDSTVAAAQSVESELNLIRRSTFGFDHVEGIKTTTTGAHGVGNSGTSESGDVVGYLQDDTPRVYLNPVDLAVAL